MSQRRKLILIPILLLAAVASDQATKSLAIIHLKWQGAMTYLGNLFRLEYSENPGAFLSLGSRLSPEVRFWVLTVFVAAFLIGALIYLFREDGQSPVQVLGISLMIGGGVSNLLDRMFRTNGQVVDFMNVGIGPVRTGIFNFADVYIMGGMFMLLYFYWRIEEKSGKKSSAGGRRAKR